MTITRQRAIWLAIPIVLSFGACHRERARQDPAANKSSVLSNSVTATSVSPAKSGPSDDQVPSPPARFDMTHVTVSTVPLGAFPYVGLPDGYVPLNKPTTLDFGHFPFWDGTGLHWVEGRIFYESIDTVKGKPFSGFELDHNLEAVIAQAGGVPVADSRIPPNVAKTIGSDITVDMNGALGDIYNDPVRTWVIRRSDREIWLHSTMTTAMGTLTVAETRPFVATAHLLPAAELKADIDSQGKAVLHINFDTDKATIQPSSQAQIGEVAALLKSDPSLRLGIDGYSDGTGQPDHNLALSQARARSVVVALVAMGIVGDRLVARGFGDSHPVASNETDDGKAQNRRVELVRL